MQNVLNSLCLEEKALFYNKKQVSVNYFYIIFYNEWFYKETAELLRTEEKFKHSQVLNPHQKKYRRPSMLDKVSPITATTWNIA